ncbi:InlB B-repeat-containing protein [Methanorbis rubei]|uniref:InlB B-repeat-containing protein n=1 Tax=Methanorbis rubei TaxID=3028300 RepID=UPI0030B878DB
MGSIGVMLYCDDTKTAVLDQATIEGNIISTDSDVYRKIGIGIYKVKHISGQTPDSINILGNTIDLSKGTSSAGNDSLIFIGNYVNATLNLNVHDNIFTGDGKSSVIYVDSNSIGEVTLKGSIYNNAFTGFGTPGVTLPTNSADLKWNAIPSGTITYGTGDKAHIAVGDVKAGNWWGDWSSGKKNPTGYLTYATPAEAKAAGLPVADLYPLVTVGAAPTKTIIVTGNFSVAANVAGAQGTLHAKFSDDSSGTFTWTPDGSGVITSSSATTGSSFTYNAVKTGTANLTVSADGVQKTVLITVYNVTSPEPIQEPIKEANGNTSITVSTGNFIEADPTEDHKAIIEDKNSGATMVVTFNEKPQMTDKTVEGNVTAVGVIYPPDVAVTPPEGGAKVPKKASYQLNLSLGNVTSILPIISPDYDADVSLLILSQGYTAATMITASAPANHNLDEINSNITAGGILVNFTVPKEWVDAIGRNNIKAFHVKNGKVDMLDIVYMSPDPTDPVTITVKGNEFSAIVLAAYTGANPGPNPGPQPVSSSSDGNMENAFRVLFDAKGGSFVQPATGLSYGDRVPEPVTPTKDGYVFGGWYKDEAMNILWIFKEDALPGDMTLYAKWISGSTGATTQQQSAAITQPTASATQKQTSSATAVTSAATTSSAGVSPTMTQAPAPIAGLLVGLFAAGFFLRRKE